MVHGAAGCGCAALGWIGFLPPAGDGLGVSDGMASGNV
jgi:hypothetical protein